MYVRDNMLSARRYCYLCVVFIGLLKIKDLSHENLNWFAGACVDAPHICLVWHYCARGSLQVGQGQFDTFIV